MDLVDLVWNFLRFVVCVVVGVSHGLGFASTCLMWCYVSCGGCSGDGGYGHCTAHGGCGNAQW